MGQVCSGSVVTRDDSHCRAPRVHSDSPLDEYGEPGCFQLPPTYNHPTQLRVVLGELQQLQLRCGTDAQLGDALDEGQLQELQVAFGKECSLEDVIQHLVVCDLRRQVYQRRATRPLRQPLAAGIACF